MIRVVAPSVTWTPGYLTILVARGFTVPAKGSTLQTDTKFVHKNICLSTSDATSCKFQLYLLIFPVCSTHLEIYGHRRRHLKVSMLQAPVYPSHSNSLSIPGWS